MKCLYGLALSEHESKVWDNSCGKTDGARMRTCLRFKRRTDPRDTSRFESIWLFMCWMQCGGQALVGGDHPSAPACKPASCSALCRGGGFCKTVTVTPPDHLSGVSLYVIVACPTCAQQPQAGRSRYAAQGACTGRQAVSAHPVMLYLILLHPMSPTTGVIVLDDGSNQGPLPSSSHGPHLQTAHQQQQPGIPTPTRCLFGGAQAAPPQPNSKPTLRSAQKHGGSGGHGARSSGGGQQTKLNSYYPVLDSSSRDSDLSGGASGLHPHHLHHHPGSAAAAAPPQQPISGPPHTAATNGAHPASMCAAAQPSAAPNQAAGRCSVPPAAAGAAAGGVQQYAPTPHQHMPSNLGRAPSVPCTHGQDTGDGTEGAGSGTQQVAGPDAAQVAEGHLAQVRGGMPEGRCSSGGPAYPYVCVLGRQAGGLAAGAGVRF